MLLVLHIKTPVMLTPALQAYNAIIRCFQNPVNDIDNIEEYIGDLVNAIFNEYEPSITEWSSNYDKVNGKDTTSADAFFFNERRIVIGYKFLHEKAKYIHIVAALMKDFPKPNLSIRKAIFLYDASLHKIVQIENETPKV
jgi:hypothetical protein